MAKFWVTIIIPLFLTSEFSFAQVNHPDTASLQVEAQLKFRQHLAFLDTLTNDGLNFQQNFGRVSLKKIKSSVLFMESLTGISSNAKHTHFGRYVDISREDYKKWQKWYQSHQEKLIWNVEERKIELLKR